MQNKTVKANITSARVATEIDKTASKESYTKKGGPNLKTLD